MTQPQPADPQSSTGQVVAATAIGLALVALEARVREQVEDDVQQAITIIAAALVIAVAAGVLTGTALLSRPDVHDTIKTQLDQAAERSAAAIEAAYAAGAQLALTKAQRELKGLGHEVPSTLPDLGTNSSQLSADITLAFNQGLADMQNTIRDAFDGVTGPDPIAARQLVVNQAAETVGKRLGQRTQATAGNAPNQGASDALNAIYAGFADVNPYITLRKRWRTTAVDPCTMCRALNGTTVAVGAEFDHTAGQGTVDYRPVWRGLQGPPRHPNCRCQLELVAG